MGAPDLRRDPEQDEELSLAPGGRSRLRLAAQLLIAVALLIAGALRFTMHHRPPPIELAAPGTTSTRHPPVLSADQLGELVALHSNPATCPPTIECAESTVLPVPFVAAVAGRLPTLAVHVMVAVTQTNPPRVYYRQLDGTTDRVAVSVRVTRSDIMDGLASTSSSRIAGGSTDRFVRFVTPTNYEVVVEASGPTPQTPSLAAMRHLSADPRLLDVS
jgi:hypothetical protein